MRTLFARQTLSLMTYIFVRLALSVLLFFAFHSLVGCQDWKVVHDGIEYAEITRMIDGQPVQMNLLRVDLV